MNLLELQLLAVVSRISDGNDVPFPDVGEPLEEPPDVAAGTSAGEAAPRQTAADAGVKLMV